MTRPGPPPGTPQDVSLFLTIPRTERMGLLGQIVHHLSDQIPSLGLFYVVDSTIYSKRIANMTKRTDKATQAWNAEEWDLG